MRIDSKGLSDTGRKRKQNEDSYFIDPSTNLFVVADGMGGHAAGEVASRIAVNAIRDFIQEANQNENGENDSGDPPKLGAAENLMAAIQLANDRILRDMEENLKHLGMGTTVVALWMVNNRAFIGHVGDSRAYLVRNGKIRQLTSDHTLVNEQVRRGILTSSEARQHPSRNILTRAVGSHGQVVVDINEEDLQNDDYLLLCSDGLYSMVEDPRILKIVTQNFSNPGKASESLIQAANEQGGEDNITVILLKINTSGRK